MTSHYANDGAQTLLDGPVTRIFTGGFDLGNSGPFWGSDLCEREARAEILAYNNLKAVQFCLLFFLEPF